MAQRALLAACPDPDILVNNNGGPPLRDFRELSRAQILEGVTQNLVTPIELIQAVIDPMRERGFGRIVNITSLSVYQPIPGLDLSSGARAGLTAFLAGVRAYRGGQRTSPSTKILPASSTPTASARRISFAAKKSGLSEDEQGQQGRQRDTRTAPRHAEEFGNTARSCARFHAGYITGQNFVLDGGLYPSAF